MKGLYKYYKIMLTTLYPQFYISSEYIEADYQKFYYENYNTLESLIIDIEKELDN